MRRSRIGMVLVAVTASGAAGCSTAFVRGAGGFDAGTLAVSGVETGVGGHAEVVAYSGRGGTGFGLGPAFQAAGYSSAGDADPISFTTLEIRYRWRQRAPERSGAYWEVGSGVGAAFDPNLQRVAVPLQAEVGLQTALGGAILTIGIRERFLALLGTGSPPTDVFNSVHLVGGLGIELGGS